jgi:hypothetical protein
MLMRRLSRVVSVIVSPRTRVMKRSTFVVVGAGVERGEGSCPAWIR